MAPAPVSHAPAVVATTVRRILQSAASPEVRAADDVGCVWHVKDPGILAPRSRSRAEQVRLLKQRVVQALVLAGTAVIYHHESPAGQLPGVWLPSRREGGWRAEVIVDSFHDGVSWVVVLASAGA